MKILHSQNLDLAFEALERFYGSHSHVAKEVGVSVGHYRKIRNGRVPVPKRTADLIILKAQEVPASDPSVTRERAAVSV